MNFCESLILPLVHRINHPGMSLACLPYLKRHLGKNGEDVVRLMQSPVWEARWVSSQKIADHFSAEQAQKLLFGLAQDPERNVREGAAHGLGFLLARYPEIEINYVETLVLPEAPLNVRRAVLHSSVVLWRHFPEKVALALRLLKTAASQPPDGCFRTIGSHLVAVELRKTHPQEVEKIAMDWTLSPNENLRYHAARLTGKETTASPRKMPEDWADTSQIPVPDDLLEQVIGQDDAVRVIRLAARQSRFVMLVGEPGTGKSMLAKAMAGHLHDRPLQDVLAVPNPLLPINPSIKTLPGATGATEIVTHNHHMKNKIRSLQFIWGVVCAGSVICGTILSFIYKGWIIPLLTLIVFIGLLRIKNQFQPKEKNIVPHLLIDRAQNNGGHFVDATGFQFGALLGDVRHDPYQSGGRETPPHLLLVPGAIHLAHQGILYIDEIGSLSLESQQQLLTAIQEKKFPIMGRSLGSSGSMVRSQPVPCDFVLCLAGNTEDLAKLHPALRSRVQGFGYEIFMKSEMDDTPDNRERIARFIAQEVQKDGKIPHFTRNAVDAVIDCALRMTGHGRGISLRLRELGGIVRAAGDLAVTDHAEYVERPHVLEALNIKNHGDLNRSPSLI